MPTKLEKTLKREIVINGEPHIATISPEGVKVTKKGFRKGNEITWQAIASGDARSVRISMCRSTRVSRASSAALVLVGGCVWLRRRRDLRRRCIGEVLLNDHPASAAVDEHRSPRATDRVRHVLRIEMWNAGRWRS